MTTLSPIQQKTLDKVSTWIQEFFSHVPWEPLDDEHGFGLFMGSAWVEVAVRPWKEDTVINVSSNVVSGAKVDQELLQFLRDLSKRASASATFQVLALTLTASFRLNI